MNIGKDAEVRQSAAAEILDLAGEIERIAEDVSNRTLCRLQMVMYAATPETANGETVKPLREFPELFDILRTRLLNIRSSLSLINNGIDCLGL